MQYVLIWIMATTGDTAAAQFGDYESCLNAYGVMARAVADHKGLTLDKARDEFIAVCVPQTMSPSHPRVPPTVGSILGETP